MKRIVLSLAIVSLSFATAQKKEISNAYKAIESGDNGTAVSQLSAAETAMGDKTFLLEPETLEQYYYVKGLTLMNAGKTQEGAAFLAKINDLGKMKIFTGKDANRDRVYYVGKAAADKSGISNLKEETYTTTTSAKLGQKINPILQSTNKQAVDAYNSKNYGVAGDKFKETYYLLKAAGTDDKSILMNAAISYATAEKLNESVEIYNDLINSGYTGIETTYSAKNKQGEVEKLDKAMFDLYKKTPTSQYTDFKTETSKSIEKDLYTINAKNLYNAKRYDEAIQVADKGLVKFPADSDLMNVKGLSFYGSGKSAEFISILRSQVAANPKDADTWFNLGVMLSKDKDPAILLEAENAFNKALEIKPTYVAAVQNLTQLKIGDDDKMRADYEVARKAGKTEQANQILESRRARLMSALPFAEKWYALDPNDIDAVSLLKNLYMTAKNDAKMAEFKAKETAMKAKTGK